jgi:hypothetical protein
MQLLRVEPLIGGSKPTRYYIDGRRVTYEAYEEQKVLASIKNKAWDSFYTKVRKTGYYHYSRIQGEYKPCNPS